MCLRAAQPEDHKSEIEKLKGAEDSGAGVFGALLHMEKPDDTLRGKKKKKQGFVGSLLGKDETELVEDEEEDDDDVEEETPKWKVDRPFLPGMLEEQMRTPSPFESYELSLGSKFGTLLTEPDYRVTAKFKGIVRVVDGHQTPPPLFDLTPESVCRLVLTSLLSKHSVMLFWVKGRNFEPRKACPLCRTRPTQSGSHVTYTGGWCCRCGGRCVFVG